ncbi:hypothetical protein ACWEF6_24905 [Amycolatopsis sp. NPDC004772]
MSRTRTAAEESAAESGAVSANTAESRPGAIGSGAIGSGAIGPGAIGSGAIGSGAIGSGAIGTDAGGTGAGGAADGPAAAAEESISATADGRWAVGGTADGPPAAEATRATAGEPPTGPDSAATADGEATEPGSAATLDGEPAATADDEPAEAEAEREAAETAAAPVKPRPGWRRLPVLLLAAAVVLTGAGVWFTLEARSAANTPAAANLALTDVGATADVTSAVTLAVNRIFSYSYDRTDVTEKAAAAVLRGPAKDSYDKLFAEVRRKAPEQKLVLTSRVSAIAVQTLENGHARLLVFLDQSAVRADNNATDSAAAQLSVTAEHTTGGWVITELEPR